MERKKYKKQKDTTPDLDKFLSDEKKRYISYDTVVLGMYLMEEYIFMEVMTVLTERDFA